MNCGLKIFFLLFLPVMLSPLYGTEVFVSKIWDKAPHSGFTSLIVYNGVFYCTFREALSHVNRSGEEKENGCIRILTSKDGIKWNPLPLIKGKGDLRDAALSITPDGKLMLLITEVTYKNNKTSSIQTMVTYYTGSPIQYSNLIPVRITIQDNTIIFNRWLWKITWHENKCYGVAYGGGKALLVDSDNGIDYQVVTPLHIEGNPSEASIAFDNSGKMVMALRCDGNNEFTGLLGVSLSPFKEWEWNNTGIRFGGPFLFFDNEFKLFSSRDFTEKGIRTSVYVVIDDSKLEKIIQLPSGGDCSYAGMIIYKNELYISYYSSQEDDKASIYLAKITLNDLKEKIVTAQNVNNRL